jgi:hypothetical protein
MAQHATILPEIARPYTYVCCLASNVCHLMPAVCFLRSLVKLSSFCCLPPSSTACYVLSSFCRFSLIATVCSLFCCLQICCLMSRVCCLLSAFCFLLFAIYCLLYYDVCYYSALCILLSPSCSKKFTDRAISAQWILTDASASAASVACLLLIRLTTWNRGI